MSNQQITIADTKQQLLFWLFDLLQTTGQVKNRGELITYGVPTDEELILTKHVGFTSITCMDNKTPSLPKHASEEVTLESLIVGKTIGIYFRDRDNFVPSRFFVTYWLDVLWKRIAQNDIESIEIYDIPKDFLLLFLAHYPRTAKPIKLCLVKQKLGYEHIPFIFKMNLSLLAMVHPGFPVCIVLDAAPGDLELEIWDPAPYTLQERHLKLKLGCYVPPGQVLNRSGVKQLSKPHWVVFPNLYSLDVQ